MLKRGVVRVATLLVTMACFTSRVWGNEVGNPSIDDNSVDSILGNDLLTISESNNAETGEQGVPNATLGGDLPPDFVRAWTPPPPSALPKWLLQMLNQSVSPQSLSSTTTSTIKVAVSRSGNDAASTSASSTTTTVEPPKSGSRSLGINPFRNLLSAITSTPTSSTTTTQRTTSGITTTRQTTQIQTDIPENAPQTIGESTKANFTAGTMATVEPTKLEPVTTLALNVTSVGSNVTNSGQKYESQYRMCGYPPICDQEACLALNWTQDPLKMCENPGSKGGFIFIVLIIALAIIFGNLLLPLVVWKNRELRTQHNLTKVSLSFADIITGLILLFSVIPNIVGTMSSTEYELGEQDKATTNSAQAVVAGSMLMLSAQASLFHLTYLSIERFIAIKWPLWHRFNGPQKLSVQIGAIWAVSIIAAYIPAAFTNHFSYRYLPVLFIYLLTANNTVTDASGITYVVLVMAIPFTVMVCFTILTGVTVWIKMRSSQPMTRYPTRKGDRERSTTNGSAAYSVRKMRADSDDADKREIRPEVAVFMTLGIMIIGFCLTILPFILVFALFYSGYYDCSNYAVPYAAAFYASTSNSFVNVLVYTVRDEKFRMGLKRVFMGRNRARWNTQKSKSATMSTSLSSPHPTRTKKPSPTERVSTTEKTAT